MNKIVLITGATSGIGEACAKAFANTSKYDIILSGRNQERLGLMKSLLENEHCRITTLTFDVRKLDAVKSAIESLSSDWRKIDVLINNAGLALGLDSIDEGNHNDWETMIDTNMKGLLNVSSVVIPIMKERNCGHIINIGSLAGDAAYHKGNVYCATKAAVKTISDGMRIDLAHTNIRVTNVKPGLVKTNLSKTRFHGDENRAEEVYKGIQPLTGDDIADVVRYASEAPSHVQIAEVLVLATHQANASYIYRE